jgi:hypothetical protein
MKKKIHIQHKLRDFETIHVVVKRVNNKQQATSNKQQATSNKQQAINKFYSSNIFGYSQWNIVNKKLK